MTCSYMDGHLCSSFTKIRYHEGEEKILKNLSKVSKNNTTIIVSHRISSAKNADKIIVLDGGIVIQKGTHDELVNIDGYYKELYLNQLSETSN